MQGAGLKLRQVIGCGQPRREQSKQEDLVSSHSVNVT